MYEFFVYRSWEQYEAEAAEDVLPQISDGFGDEHGTAVFTPRADKIVIGELHSSSREGYDIE